ncbi:MAG TPA: SCP2 sterol-binding domain-containing protein [Gaiellaceae bacterium]|nr:SCP2 sterol-binding domain-containing protein [Gaiellaceae bacterium]
MAASAREFFQDLAARTAGGSERTRGLTASYRFDVDGAGSWRVDVDDGAVTVTESDAAADCVIGVSEEMLLGIVSGRQSPMGAFLMGRIRVDGDAGLAMRLRDLLA